MKVRSIEELEPLLDSSPMQPSEAFGGAAEGDDQGGAGGPVRAEIGSYNAFIAPGELIPPGKLKNLNPQGGGEKVYRGEPLTEGRDYQLIAAEGNCIAIDIRSKAAAHRIAIGSYDNNGSAWCTSWPDGQNSMFQEYIEKGPLVALLVFDGSYDMNKNPEHRYQATFAVEKGADDFKDKADIPQTLGYDNEGVPEPIARIPLALREKVADYVVQKSGKGEEAYKKSQLLGYWDPRKWPSRVLAGLDVAGLLELYGLYEGKNCEVDREKKIVYVTDPEYVYKDDSGFGEPIQTF
jgi:hypothetical protein